MSSKLTSIAVRKAKPAKTRRELPDGGSGLYLVVQPSGRKSWALRYRQGGSTAKLTLGQVLDLEAGELEPDSAPELGQPLTLGQARELAAGLARDIRRGKKLEPMSVSLGKVAVTTTASGEFETVVDDFIQRYVRPTNRARSAAETARLLKTKALPAWRGRRLEDIQRRDVIALLDQIASDGAPISANRTLAALRRMFNWCVERDLLAISPCDRVKAPTPESSRDRVLSDNELTLVWAASQRLGAPFGPFIRMLMLTGQRRDEVAGMRWSELDLKSRLWRLPRERVKNNSAHDVPLSDQAMAVIEGMPNLAGEPDYVFTSGLLRGRDHATRVLAPVSGFSKTKIKLDKLVGELANRSATAADNASTGLIAPWRFHDLRRSVATGMASLGVALPVIEKVLNHRSGSFAGIVGVYQRHSYADEKREALARWGAKVESLGAGGSC